jgi:hypothetical protein
MIPSKSSAQDAMFPQMSSTEAMFPLAPSPSSLDPVALDQWGKNMLLTVQALQRLHASFDKKFTR